MDGVFFPHENIRPIQHELLALVNACVRSKRHLVVHAPTGLGKTAAAIAPALSHALERDLCVVFVTPRHTQHIIALRTAREMKDKHSLKFGTVTIVGRRSMCAQEIAGMRQDDFTAFCRGMRESSQCAHFVRSRATGTASIEARHEAETMLNGAPLDVKDFVERGKEMTLCPYELALIAASSARLIITDYHYLFMPSIRDKFLARIGKKPEQLIVIVDEAHNLASRVRESLTKRLGTSVIKRAIQETKEYSLDEAQTLLTEIAAAHDKLASGVITENAIEREQWQNAMDALGTASEIEETLHTAASHVEEQRRKGSAIANVVGFIHNWRQAEGDAFARIMSREERGHVLSLRCLDPSVITSPFIKDTHCTILMSGTLRPTKMFVDILGMPEDTVERELPSPFPSHNKLCLVIPDVTTRYSQRNEALYLKIAERITAITDNIDGCSAVYFPSYRMLEDVEAFLATRCKHTVFRESPGLSREERSTMLQRFSGYKDRGAVLLGVASGSFGEGVDMPGVLRCVIVVGIPLEKPTLETQQLIAYFDKRFGKGWDYGYTLPALTRTLQNAGRCIRSESDRGALVFMDERYAWPSYRKCFPDDWDMSFTNDPIPRIKDFFASNK